MRVAIIHDWLPYVGGAEKVIRTMLELFPDAILYTSIYNKKRMGDFLNGTRVETSFIDKLPFGKTRYGMYLGLMPYAFEQFDLRGYDLVLSSSTSCAKGVLTDANTLHICYCNTPMRYAWDFYFDYLYKGKNLLRRVVIHSWMHKIRLWDKISADRVDYYIANSENVARRITKHYRRVSEVIYPPVALPQEGQMYEDIPLAPGSYYLVVSRLVAYKRIDLAVEAFNRLGKPLIIAGEGPEKARLEHMAGPNILFVGRVSDAKKAALYRDCKAFLFPGEEDFGITPVEAQAYGKPVIAYGRGGALETVKEGITGTFFRSQDADSLEEAVKCTEDQAWNPVHIKENAAGFSEAIFKKRLMVLILEKMDIHNKTR